MFQYILPMWSECLTICCPSGQSVSPYVARVVRVSHHILVWSDCIPYSAPCGQSVTIYCDGQSVAIYCDGQSVTIYCPRGQSVSPYDVSIYAVYMVSMYCPCGQSVSHVVKVYPIWCPCGHRVSQYDVSIYAVYMVGMFRYVLPVWSEYIPHNAHVVRVYPT